MCEKTFVGLDVHKDTTTIVAIDGSGKSRVESVVITDAKVICATLLSLPGEVHITFEVGTQSNWLYRQTKAVVKEVIVCNARENKLVQVGNKSDLIDAGKLAELLRLGALKAVWQHSAEQVYLKELVRIYENLVVDSTRVMNRVKAIYRGFCVATSDQLFYEIEGRDKRLAKLTEKGSRFRAEMLFTQLDKLLELRDQAKTEMIREAKKHKDFRRLLSIPGLGQISVARLLMQVGDPYRFKNKRSFWKYCGFAVETSSSADYRIVDQKIQKKVRQSATRGLTAHYNHRLKNVFKMAAQKTAGCEPFSAYYEKLLNKGTKESLARVSLARKIAAISLSIWKKQTEFDQKMAMAA